MQVTVDLGHFPEFKDDAAFASGMLVEQSVFTLPGMVRLLCQTRAGLGGSEIMIIFVCVYSCRRSQPLAVSE